MAFTPERSTEYQGCQIGVETVAGVRVPCVHRLLGAYIEPVPQDEITVHRGYGSQFNTGAARRKPHTLANITGEASFTEIGYLLAGMLCLPAITTPAGATATRLWTFLPNSFAPNPVQSYTLEHGAQDSFCERCLFTVIRSLGLRASETEIGLTGQAMGRELDENAIMTETDDLLAITNPTVAPTLTPAAGGTLLAGVYTVAYALRNVGGGTTTVTTPVTTTVTAGQKIGVADLTPLPTNAVSVDWYISPAPGDTTIRFLTNNDGTAFDITAASDLDDAVIPTGNSTSGTVASFHDYPFQPNKVTVRLGDSLTDLDKMLRNIEHEFSFTDRLSPLFVQDDDDGDSSYESYVELAPRYMVRLTVEHDDQSKALMQDLKDRKEKFFQLQYSGDAIEAGFVWRLRITGACFATAPGRGDQGGAYGATYELQGRHDDSLGSGIKVELWTTQTALS